MKREIICGIYKITSPSGKIYIGESEDILKRKSYYNRLACKQQRKLYSSLNKYGWKEHIFEIIELCDYDDLLCRERYWQDFYDVIGKNGLNLVLTNCGDVKGKFSEETLKLMSGENNPCYGKPSPTKGIPRDSINHPSNKIAINTENLEEYISITRLAKEIGMNRGTLCFYLSHNERNPTVYMLKEDYEKYGKIVPCDSKNFVKEVIDISTNIIYKSATEASKILNLNRRNLCNELNGKAIRKTALYFYSDWLSGNIKIYEKEPKSKKVINIKTLIIYNSILEASKTVEISSNNLSARLKNPERNTTDFMYLWDYELNGIKEEIIIPYGSSVRVIDTLTLKRYSTIKEAAEDLGITSGNLTRYLSGERLNKTYCIYEKDYIEGVIHYPRTKN